MAQQIPHSEQLTDEQAGDTAAEESIYHSQFKNDEEIDPHFRRLQASGELFEDYNHFASGICTLEPSLEYTTEQLRDHPMLREYAARMKVGLEQIGDAYAFLPMASKPRGPGGLNLSNFSESSAAVLGV